MLDLIIRKYNQILILLKIKKRKKMKTKELFSHVGYSIFIHVGRKMNFKKLK